MGKGEGEEGKKDKDEEGKKMRKKDVEEIG